jgi:putative PIN family toxin of toxin-antitoxin system
MMVVFDTNVVVSGIFWAGPSRKCLIEWAHRRFQLAITREILSEYSLSAEIIQRKTNRNINWRAWIEWIGSKAISVEPAPLGKQRSRDFKDDMFLACGLAAGATAIISGDKDLLVLGKPFGIEVLEPREFLRIVTK